jgi:hypothetical protein
VDEFVPQFYDAASPGRYFGNPVIAAKIDGARWGPVFNRFGKRFRIGISSFGRASMAKKEERPEFFADLTPAGIATNAAFRLDATRDEAGELVLRYRATRGIRMSDHDFRQGDTIQFVLPTAEAIRAAAESARQMKGYLAGVVFFRWPLEQEDLVMQPDEALMAAAGAGTRGQPEQSSIVANDGGCAAVKCADLYLKNANPLSPEPARFRVRSSAPMDYFLHEKDLPIRMTGPNEVELSLPPYCGRRRMALGRAVTEAPSQFTLEEAQ